MSRITFGSNISSLTAQRQLAARTDSLLKSSERLASGMRINRASDDAAGLAIATNLNASERVFSQGIRNISDGLSALNIAQGSLQELSGITHRLMELAEQSANGVFTLTQRKALATEADQLTREYNRIIETTTFNGIDLLSATGGEIRIQAGFGSDGSVAYEVGNSFARTVGDGTFATAVSYTTGVVDDAITVDLNGDGRLDIVTAPRTGTGQALLGNGDGTFRAGISYITGSSNAASLGKVLAYDYNGDGRIDIATMDGADSTMSVLLGNGDGTFKARTTFSSVTPQNRAVQADFDGDGHIDIASASNSVVGVNLFFGNGDGTFKARVSIIGPGNYGLAVSDIDRDGIEDLILGQGRVQVLHGNGNGTFRVGQAQGTNYGGLDITVADFNRDGFDDVVMANYNSNTGSTMSVMLGNGNGMFAAPVTYTTITGPYPITSGDLDGDGILDLVVGGASAANGITAHFGNGDGTFRSSATIVGRAAYGISIADFNRDGAADIMTSVADIGIFLGNPARTSKLAFSNILSEAGAREALDVLGQSLERVALGLSAIGAAQSRLATAMSNLRVAVEGSRAASSRITDIDVAEESGNQVRSQIAQQAAASVLAQANQQPNLVLTLIRQS